MKKYLTKFSLGLCIPVFTLCLSSLVFAWSATTLNHGKAKWEGGETYTYEKNTNICWNIDRHIVNIFYI